MVEKCGCYDLTAEYWPALNSTPCLNFWNVSCDVAQYSIFFSQDVKSLCQECPLECNSVVYSTSTSFADYPSAAYASVLVNNPIINSYFGGNKSAITYDALKRQIVAVNVFYSDLSYNKYTELEKMNVVDLVSNIGGTLGLFLGMSFLSFIEIIDLVVQILIALVSHSNK